jgi:D-alanine transaminase|tara:strand:+ start:1553 stop:2392 length:840 start_codon:yes stop_codon:yes gene_type:complete
MVYLNGKFIPKKKAYVSVMDRGFLFGDGIYEVFPVYGKIIVGEEFHLRRLQEGLDTINIVNPHSNEDWGQLIRDLISYHQDYQNQSIYLQVSRGCDEDRKHTHNDLIPTVYMQSTAFTSKSKNDLLKGSSAITRDDIRWNQCNTKSISLLANIIYAQEAKNHQAEETILCRNGVITECSSSNIFIVNNDCIYTHPEGSHILSGVTRKIVLNCANDCQILAKEKTFTKQELMQADEVWITSSTREIMPITSIDGILINSGKIGDVWTLIYDRYQELKNIN